MSATPADAQAIMQLYKLRRDPELRKARSWFAAFDPQSPQDIMKAVMALDADSSRYYRMVAGYWEMAAAMVLHGAINEELFLDTQPEMFFTFAKVAPHIEGFRNALQMPEAMRNVETLIRRSETGKQKLQSVTDRIARMRALAGGANDAGKQAQSS